MKALALCNKSCEEFLSQELCELGAVIEDVRAQHILFFVKDEKELAYIAYHTQIARSVIFLLAETKPEEEAIVQKSKEIAWNDFLTEKSFAVFVSSIDGTEIYELARTIGGEIQDITQSKVQLVKPEVPIRILLTSTQAYIGIDLAYDDLGRRPYKIFGSSDPLNATTAMAFIRWTRYTRNTELIDHCCNSGHLCIEAALWNRKESPQHYRRDIFSFPRWMKGNFDTLFDKKITKGKKCVHAMDGEHRFVEATKKNAKIAGVDDGIEVHKMDVEWLDVKFGKGTVSYLFGAPTVYGRIPGKFSQWANEFCYQAEYLVKKDGVIALLLERGEQKKKVIEAAATKNRMEITEEHIFYQGREEWVGIKLKKVTAKKTEYISY